jgi:hypothetical protein
VNAVEGAGALRDHIDDSEHRVGAIENGAWAKRHLDVVDHFQREPEPNTERRARRVR